MSLSVIKLVSGGQSGADRAALDVAIDLSIAHGGWVPQGRWAEDGVLAACYQMRETDSPQVPLRTEWNVRDTDATLIFSHGEPTGGTALTARLAASYQKPALYVDLATSDETVAARSITAWLTEIRPAILNVAGPRASNDPLIYDAVSRILRRVFEREQG